MPQLSDLQRQLGDTKSRITDLEIQLQSATAHDKAKVEEELSRLRDEQVNIVHLIEEQADLTSTMGDVNKG